MPDRMRALALPLLVLSTAAFAEDSRHGKPVLASTLVGDTEARITAIAEAHEASGLSAGSAACRALNRAPSMLDPDEAARAIETARTAPRRVIAENPGLAVSEDAITVEPRIGNRISCRRWSGTIVEGAAARPPAPRKGAVPLLCEARAQGGGGDGPGEQRSWCRLGDSNT